MRSLDMPEIHGYEAKLGYRVYTSKAQLTTATNAGWSTQVGMH